MYQAEPIIIMQKLKPPNFQALPIVRAIATIGIMCLLSIAIAHDLINHTQNIIKIDRPINAIPKSGLHPAPKENPAPNEVNPSLDTSPYRPMAPPSGEGDACGQDEPLPPIETLPDDKSALPRNPPNVPGFPTWDELQKGGEGGGEGGGGDNPCPRLPPKPPALTS